MVSVFPVVLMLSGIYPVFGYLYPFGLKERNVSSWLVSSWLVASVKLLVGTFFYSDAYKSWNMGLKCASIQQGLLLLAV